MIMGRGPTPFDVKLGVAALSLDGVAVVYREVPDFGWTRWTITTANPGGGSSSGPVPSAHIALEPVQLYGASGSGDGPLYRPTAIDVDKDGNVYVLDRGNHRVQVFDANGVYLRTLGREGQGPGELENPSGLLVTRDHVAVKAAQRRLNTWSLDGEHVADIRLSNSLSGILGTDDGFVASYRTWFGELVPSPTTRRDFDLGEIRLPELHRVFGSVVDANAGGGAGYQPRRLRGIGAKERREASRRALSGQSLEPPSLSILSFRKPTSAASLGRTVSLVRMSVCLLARGISTPSSSKTSKPAATASS